MKQFKSIIRFILLLCLLFHFGVAQHIAEGSDGNGFLIVMSDRHNQPGGERPASPAAGIIALQESDNLLRTPPGEMIVEGKIRLYKETETLGSVGASIASSVDNYYAKKGEIFKRVFGSDLLRNRKADLDSFKTMIADDQEFLKKVEADDFTYNVKNLKRVIKDYNLKHFEGVGNTPYTTKSPATFYTLVKPKIRERLILKVNDSVEFKIHPTYPTPIQLAASAAKPSKVCLISDTGTWCEIMSPVPLETLYFELDYSPSDKSFEIKKRSPKEFKTFMEMHVLK